MHHQLIFFGIKILPSPLSTLHDLVLREQNVHQSIRFFCLELVLLSFIVCKKHETRMQFNTATS